MAREGAQILEQLTTRDDLAALSLLPLSDVISARSSVRKHAAWCPECLAQWFYDGSPIYYPLVWQLKVVVVCPTHPQQELVDCCPHCNRKHYALSRHSVVGFCPRCQYWLGEATRGSGLPTATDRGWGVKASALLGAVVRQECQPSLSVLQNNLAQVCDRRFGGSLLAFAKRSQLHHSSLQALIGGRSRPGLDTLLQLAKAAATPAEILVGHPLQLPDLKIKDEWVDGRKRKYQRYAWDKIRQVLQSAVDETEFPSLNRLCRQSGLDPSYVALRFPKLTGTLVARHKRQQAAKKRIREQSEKLNVASAVVRCVQSGEWPSDRLLKTRLKSPGCLRKRVMRRFRDRVCALVQRNLLGIRASGKKAWRGV